MTTWLDGLVHDLYPLRRSLTGDGVRATLDRIAEEISLEVREVATGTSVLDWRVPDEWNLTRARLFGPDGEVVADTDDSGLHVVGYSVPTRTTLGLGELQDHLYSLPDRPTLIPYRTSYYRRTWGFCLTDEIRRELPPGQYSVDINATLVPGSLTYGELVVPGTTSDEVLISTHVCHPDLANDNVSGIAATVDLARWVSSEPRRHTFRFLFVPATIGAITWLQANQDVAPRIKLGLVLTGLGDSGPLTYKMSRRGDSSLDRLMSHLADKTVSWSPYGYDERQFCSPGFDLPVGRLSRSLYGTYPEYHTSADNLDFISVSQIVDAVTFLRDVFDAVESGLSPRNLAPFGEPELGRRGLFRSVGGSLADDSAEMAMLWILSLADGEHDLMGVAEQSGLPMRDILRAANMLREVELLGE